MATTYGQAAGAVADTHWRTRDIVVAAIIGVAFGVVFIAWNGLWEAVGAVVLPARSLIYGVWLIPAVLAPLIVRKPGAALFAEMVAAGLSVFLGGTPWGPDALLSGFVQGAAAELVFAFTLYRSYSLPVLVVAAVASAAGAWIHDWVLYYAETDTQTMLLVGGAMAVSAVLVSALGSVALARALRQAGALEGFPD
ncbi:MAG TPA: ECF transporter S component [Candidatus Limnocylindrales bacterium]|nr:ECF transporter S component [Candidatus Limnocylindrales bacterium]